jgi:hypothetical protein
MAADALLLLVVVVVVTLVLPPLQTGAVVECPLLLRVADQRHRWPLLLLQLWLQLQSPPPACCPSMPC